MNALDSQEQRAIHLINEGKNDEAVTLLYDLVVSHAKAKNFAKAESLREQLIAVNSMALKEIINSAEIIEAEKSASIDTGHKEIWADLYGRLDEEEMNGLFYALKEIKPGPDEPLTRQGKANSRLFFVNQGELKVIFSQGQEEFLIKKIGGGGIAGADSFFPISLCTNSVITLTSCNLSYLERKTLQNLSEKLPDLESKLEEYCAHLRNIRAILDKEGIERRRHKRYNAAGKVMTQLVNAKGETLGKAFRGQLADVSAGGASFFIKSSQKTTARLLLGRRAGINIYGPQQEKAQLKGAALIVAVHSLMQNDYSVHVKFDKPLRDREIEALRSYK